MEILFLNRVFPPQAGATGYLLRELCENLAANGHKVTIIASGGGTASPSMHGSSPLVTLHRVRDFLPYISTNLFFRALSYLSLYPSFFWRALRLPRHDFVVTMTDPPLVILIGWLISRIKSSKAVHWAQDVYPEVAEEIGVIKTGGILSRIIKGCSSFALRRQDAIIVVGRCMKLKLIARGVDEAKIHVVPNWAQDYSGTPGIASTNFRDAHGLGNNFIVMYSGNFGLAHDFHALIEAVHALQSHPEISFVFIGGGPRIGEVKDRLKGCSNALFLPPTNEDQLNQTLASADIHLVCMKTNLGGLVVPSKIYGTIASGKPTLFVGPESSECSLLLKELDAGVTISAEDAQSLAAALLDFANRGPSFSDRGLYHQVSITNSAKAFTRVLQNAA